MKKQTMCLALLLPAIGFSQQIQKQVIASSGGTSSGKTVTVDQVIGEPLIEARTGTNAQLSDGFLQGLKIKVVPLSTNNINSESYAIKVYPNPTTSFVTVAGVAGSFIVQVLDPLGKKLQTKNATATCELDFTEYASGYYNLQILANEKQIGIYQIIKQ